MVQSYGIMKKTLLAATIVTGTQTFNDLGFTPNWVRIKWNGRRSDTDAVGLADCNVGVGIWAGSSGGAINNFYDQGTTAEICGSYFENDSVVVTCSAAAAKTGGFGLDAFVAGGVRLICNDQIPADMDIVIECGIATTAYAATRLLASATTGDKDFSDLGFTPASGSLVYCACTQNGYAGTLNGFGDEDIASISHGAGIVGGGQYVLALNSDDDSATMDTDSYLKSGEIMASIQQDGGASPDMRVTLTGAISGGLRFNVAESPGFDTAFLLLVLDGTSDDYAVGDYVTQTDTTTAISETVGFFPLGIATYSHGLVQSTADTTQAGAQLNLGVASSPSSRYALLFHDENGTDNQETSTAIEHDAVGGTIDTGAAIVALTDVTTLPTAGGGFDLIQDDADTINAFVFYEAFGGGADPGGGGANRRRRVLMGAR